MNNLLKVVVDERQGCLASVDQRSGVSKSTGNDWTIRSQLIWVYEQGSMFPLKVQFNLPDDVDFYPSGDYTLDLNASFSVGNYSAITLDTRLLRLVKNDVQKKA